MKTLIELYDDRAIENVLGPETFMPEKVIYLCPTEVAEDKATLEALRHFYQVRNLDIKIEFAECSFYKADKIYKQLLNILEKNEDCAVDITGGTDAALFATGMICKEKGIPAFTYSHKRNRFYDICGAEYADDLLCEIEYSVEDFFNMTGGTLRKGRVEKKALVDHFDQFDKFFALYLKYQREWVDFITFMVRISQNSKEEPIRLSVSGDYIQKGERGSRISANPNLLKDLERIKFIHDLTIEENARISFTFADEEVRFWLRDVGSVLELYMYRLCIESKLFGDVVSSAIVDWDGTNAKDSVSNEIDVVASRGVVPLFISCKACEIKTEALNELALLKDRFGGKGAKAAIVTTEICNAAARHRAAQLGIAVIDIEELSQNRALERLFVIMKVKTGDNIL